MHSEMSQLELVRIGVEEAEICLKELSLRMSGGEPLDSYVDDFRAQGQLQCTNVWSKGIIAYRCRTCQMNDSSAICVDCFQNGNHWKHDYVMYHSESGGCCDCGDRAAWKESGFCTAHQRLHVLEIKVKEELLEPTHYAVQYVLRELTAWVKKLDCKLSGQESLLKEETDMEVAMAMVYLDWSQKVCAVDALRSIFCKDIIDYEILHQTDASTSSLDVLLDCLGWMPEKLIEAETTLFLQLLYKNEFKDQFLNLLKGKYEKMIILAVNNEAYMKNYKHLDTNLDRVMVQLFNDPVMTTQLIHKYSLLELFIGVFYRVVACSAENEAVANVEHDAIKSKVYLRPQGDLRLIVTHGDIAVHLLTEQPQLFPIILDVLVKLQWMNFYFREDDDIEFENTWTLAIQLEMNSMAIIFQLISRCYRDPSVGRKPLVTAATYTIKALKQYLEVKRASDTDGSVSLHIPLHRALSAILQKLVLLPWDNHERGFLSGLKDEDAFNLTEDEVLRILDHPLRILVWMAQIRAQMWRRTSEEFSRLELIYRGSFWHDQSMDMDILLIQFCTVARENLQATIFIKIADRFDFKCMATTRMIPGQRIHRQADISLLQDFMRLILLVVRERRNLGRTEEDEAQEKCLQYDVIQWLCVRDQTYSQLCRALSAIPMNHQKLNAMLEKVAIYHEPKVADRGFYQLKPEYWKQFDPLFAHYYLNELEDAEDRAVKVGKLEHYWRIRAPPAACAPYDRLSSLLHTKACHLFLLNVLDEVRFLVGTDTTATAGEALGVTALQMLAVLVSDSRENIRNGAPKTQLPVEPVLEFPTEDIIVNIHVQIQTPDGLHRSIFQMLQELVHANQCTRLVDSVNHVFELLCFSTNEKSCAAEVDSQSAEDMQRRLRKEQRQKAILEEFAAKRKAFMELQNVSDDDVGSEDGSEMEVSNVLYKSSVEKSDTVSTSETLSKSVVPVAEADCVAMDTSSEAKECVLCKRKKDDKNSSTCWIALVQRYNFPCQVLKSGEAVTNTSGTGFSNFGQITEAKLSEDGFDHLVTVGCPADSENVTAIDFDIVDHVQCCGHQMHYDCFQGHMTTLQLSPHAGKGVADAAKAEFSCPTCRRLANVLLPDVDASISSKKLDLHEDGKDVEESGNDWSGFWQSNLNLQNAMNYFCCQVLRVREQSPQSFLNTPSRFRISQALWDGLVLNIVHYEVETRDGNVKTGIASSSSAPIKSDERIWGGDPAHWIALRELGRLAMLSNTLPGAVQEKSRKLWMLRNSLGLLDRKENLPVSDIGTEFPPIWTGMSELEKIIEEIFPQNPLDLSEPSEQVDLADMSPDFLHCQDETGRLQENSGSTPLPCHISVQEEREGELAHTNTASTRSLQLEENKDNCFTDYKHGGTHHNMPVAPDPIAPDPQQKHEFTFEDAKYESLVREGFEVDSCSSQLSSLQQKRSNSQVSQGTWISDIFTNGVFTADPFRILTLLLIIFNGQPDRHSLLSMVKFAYTVAVLQTQIAVMRLDVQGAELESLVQRACLPFLRRAAMLVQIITRQDFRGRDGLSGTKTMEFLSLQLSLKLPDCSLILQPRVHGVRESLATQLLHLFRPVSKKFTFELRKVPRKALLHSLPRVFQELLLENIHNKRTCDFCGKMPEDPAICLICGMLLCCGSDCCRENGMGECSRHAAKESAGVGIFLLLRSTQLLLLRNNRTCMGLSLYLDIHGEEDLYLRRSQLLYLSDLRLNEVRRLWMTAAFDYDSYILRNSQSRPNVY